jgi:hypothetical protein
MEGPKIKLETMQKKVELQRNLPSQAAFSRNFVATSWYGGWFSLATLVLVP